MRKNSGHGRLWFRLGVYFGMCSFWFTVGAAGVRVVGLEKCSDCLFVRGEVFGQTTFRECIVDTLITTNLLSEWTWIDANRLGTGSNATAVLIAPQILGRENMPNRLFVRMSERASENGDMRDRDVDGLPNVYEIHNGTNPYVADFERAPRISVPADCEYATLTNSLWSSSPYSIIEIKGEMYFDESIDLPGWPLLITGPTNGYAVIHSGANIGVFMVNRRQTSHTLVRNVYLTMDKKSSFQAGFWIGGNLPWSTDAAGASFENVRLRMYNPGTWYYGWHLYGITDTPVIIKNCVISAAGATDVLPVYVYGDSQIVVTNGLELVNMPSTAVTEGHTWAGYSLAEQYDPLRDYDGDGLNDHDEVFLYGTDPYLRDSDGDRISDLEEVRHGADPTNQNIYCFKVAISVGDACEEVGGVKLAFYEQESGRRVSEIAEMSNQTNEVDLHCLVRLMGKPVLRMWSASEETYVLVPYTMKWHDNRVTVPSPLVRSLYDADGDEVPDVWEVAHGLSPQDANDAGFDSDGDGLINLHEYWARTDPHVVDGTNTLLSVASRSVDRLIETDGLERTMFTNYPSDEMPRVVVPNPNFFARSIDLSAVSVWNSQSSTQRCVTAVSPYHVVGAAHWQVSPGYSVYFLGNDGIVYSNKIQAASSFEYHYWNSPANTLDVSIGILEAPLPEAVRPVKVLPIHAAEYIGSGKRLPVLSLSQDRCAYVREISSSIDPANPAVSTSISYGCSLKESRRNYYGHIRGGDSSCPNFLLCGSTPVLLGCHLTASGAPSIILTQPHMQRMMNELSDRTGKPRHELQFFDLTPFQLIGGIE